MNVAWLLNQQLNTKCAFKDHIKTMFKAVIATARKDSFI